MAAHDIAHALGFDTERMIRLDMISSAMVNWSPNKVIKFVKSPNTIEVVKKYYDCERADNGMRLDMRSTEIPSSHWDRHVAKDELMSTYGDESSGMFYTALTLATFHDMKFYRANFSMAEPMSWGKKGGCAVFRKLGKSKHKNPNSKMLCKEESDVLQCTSDRFGLGTCAQTNFSRGVHGERKSTPDDYLNESLWHKPSWPVVETEPGSADAAVFKPVDNEPHATTGTSTGKNDSKKSSKSDTASRGSNSGSKTAAQSRKAKNIPNNLDDNDLPPEMMNLSEEERALYRDHLLANGGIDGSTTTTLMTSILALLCLAAAILVSP
ncbi:hypothetical protein LSM04_009485 [Trypanosoma melophagium]|uniref:uncharacterized protein n=1 Tax=Trypanosoma melophagium TaxID=715481 RepID=UPI003519EC8D|nr:hypothetical protein LSM04_009485 [Trypanosoma melophagium]